MKLIYENNKRILAQVIPGDQFFNGLTGTNEEKMIHIANKVLPTGTKYEIVEDSEIPNDRSFRNAWEYVSGSDDERTSADLSAEDLRNYNMTENI